MTKQQQFVCPTWSRNSLCDLGSLILSQPYLPHMAVVRIKCRRALYTTPPEEKARDKCAVLRTIIIKATAKQPQKNPNKGSKRN